MGTLHGHHVAVSPAPHVHLPGTEGRAALEKYTEKEFGGKAE